MKIVRRDDSSMTHTVFEFSVPVIGCETVVTVKICVAGDSSMCNDLAVKALSEFWCVFGGFHCVRCNAGSEAIKNNK